MTYFWKSKFESDYVYGILAVSNIFLKRSGSKLIASLIARIGEFIVHHYWNIFGSFWLNPRIPTSIIFSLKFHFYRLFWRCKKTFNIIYTQTTQNIIFVHMRIFLHSSKLMYKGKKNLVTHTIILFSLQSLAVRLHEGETA